VAGEGATRDAAGDNIRRTVSLDAYRRNVGGSITLAVTGTDNPVPSQLSERQTPPKATPAVTAGSDAPVVPDASDKKPKKTNKKKS
jgi:hypothetical protein